jgi:hypothetical protein
MSISQVKKQFEEFAAYLGRDTVGLDKLRKLKDAVNVIRTRLSSSEERELEAVELKAVATSRAASAELKLEDALSENRRLNQLIQNLTRDLELSKKPAVSNEKDLPQDDEGHTTTEAELKSAIKQLRSRMRYCPMAVRRSDGVYTFDRDSFSRGWSHQSLWELGASVAMLSFFFGKVTIRSSKVIKDMEMDRDPNSNMGVGRHIVQWLRRNIDVNSKPSVMRAFEPASD